MSGIAGAIETVVQEDAVHGVLSSLAQRGSGAQGIYREDGCFLAQSGCYLGEENENPQLLQLKWNTETYTVLYDGVLYNSGEIRSLLAALGHRFTGESNAEVVLHAYAQWAEGCLQRFNGIFAMAVWETKRKKLFLARDRIGVKPLFYTLQGRGLRFGSEIKNILAFPDSEPTLDARGVTELLMLGPGRVPGSGVFRNIYELEPGCFGYFYCGKWSWKRYWRLVDREHTEDFRTTAEHVHDLLTDAIQMQTVSEENMGMLLSGGLDSSLISSVVAVNLSGTKRKLRTFSVDFSGNDEYFIPGKFQPESDAAYIRIMTEYLGSDHSLTVQTPEDLVGALDAATQARDLPGMADVDFSLYKFCAEIRKHVKVALSGECSDEIFGGYPWYRDPEIRNREEFPWARNTEQRAAFLDPRFSSIIDPIAFVKEQYDRTVHESDILPGTSDLDRRMKQMVNLNHRWFMQTLLDRNDRMSGHNGLEVRVPFCDYRIVEYMYGVPWEYKDHNGMEKGLLRYAMRDYLPEKIRTRKKSPYPKTYNPVYLSLVSDRLRSVLERKDAPIFSIIRKDALEGLLQTQMTQPWYGQLMQLPQTIAYMLQINRWLELYKVQVVE